MSVREYVGARYVPIVVGEWDKTRTYEPLMVVTYQGNSYTSRQYVPTGIEITNENYWILSANYNAQIDAYRNEVTKFDGRIAANATAISAETTRATEAESKNADAIDANTTANAEHTNQLAAITDSGLKTLITNLDAQVEQYRQEAINLQKVVFKTFNTYEDMQNSNLIDNQIYQTLGYYTAGDSGAAIYQIVNGIPTIINTIVTPKMYGAKDILTFDSKSIFETILNLKSFIFIPSNETYYTSPISIENKDNFSITGGTIKSFIPNPLSQSANMSLITFTNCNNFTLKDVTINVGTTWIERPGAGESGFNEYLTMRQNTYDGIGIYNCKHYTITDCEICYSKTGIYQFNTGTNESSDFSFTNLYIHHTLSDSMFSDGNNKHGIVSNCRCYKCDDDSFSFTSQTAGSFPEYINVSNCHSNDCYGGLVNFYGAQNCYLNNSTTNNCKQSFLKLGNYYDTHGNFVSLGHDCHINNCSFNCNNINYYTQSDIAGLILADENHKSYNISINNCVITTTYTMPLRTQFIENCNLTNNIIKGFTYTLQNANNITFNNNTFDNVNSFINITNSILNDNRVLNTEEFICRDFTNVNFFNNYPNKITISNICSSVKTNAQLTIFSSTIGSENQSTLPVLVSFAVAPTVFKEGQIIIQNVTPRILINKEWKSITTS